MSEFNNGNGERNSGNSDIINLIELTDALDIPRELATSDLIVNYLIPSVIEEYSDGEIRLFHKPLDDTKLVHLFGKTSFEEGIISKKLRDLELSNNSSTKFNFKKLIGLSAKFLSYMVINGEVPSVSQPNIEVDKIARKVTFDTQSVRLKETPEYVVDLGPGIKGKHHIDRQIDDNILRKTFPYIYFPITKGPFISRFLVEYANTKLQEDKNQFIAYSSYLWGIDKGMAEGTSYLIDTPLVEENTGVIIASGVHKVEASEINEAFNNCANFMKSGSLLVIRAPKQKISENIFTDADEMVQMALNAGLVVDSSHDKIITTSSEMTGKTKSRSVALIKP